MRSLVLLITLSAAATSSLAQSIPISDFECQPAGQIMTTSADCEFWMSIDGTGNEIVLPDNSWVTGPCAGMPTSGSQWCEVTSTGLGPANPVVAPASPGTWPFQPGSVAEMQLTTGVPSFPSGQTGISVDWYWMTQETQNGSQNAPAPCPCNDFSQIVIIDATTSNIVATLVYVDTYTPFQVFAGNSCTSAVSQGGFANFVSPLQTATLTLPSALINQQIIISVVTANQADSSFESSLFVDNFRFVDPVATFNLTATTTGGGVGDVALDIANVPPLTSNVLLLISATPAFAGLGTGPAFGLVPDSLFFATLFEPVQNFSVLHFPAAFSPFAAGPLAFPAGTITGVNGQTWEATALAYNPVMGLVGQTNFQALVW